MTDTLSVEQNPAPTNVHPASVLRIRNFRLLWIGEGISMFGDQFYLIALPQPCISPQHNERELAAWGCVTMISDVWQDAVGFYKKLGWSTPGAVLLRRRLCI